MERILRSLVASLFIAVVPGLFAQTILDGIVTEKGGSKALVGVAVLEKGTLNGTTTDASGRFSITCQGPLPATLVVSFLGYEAQDIVVSEATPLRIELARSVAQLDEVVITARRRKETAQEVPIAISVVSGAKVEEVGAFNVNRVKELIPSVQLYSSNPRNTGLSIRGLGSSFGLTNDGLDPGVGFYVDGVYFARPAAATLDFVDIEQIEVLRGPQGTLFGKNTTSGAFNVTTRKASFTPGANYEVSYGNFGYVQAKASVTGPLSKKIAVRASFSGTQRDGQIENIRTNRYINDINNLGGKVQFLWKPSDKVAVTLAGDATRQRPDGYAQVVAGVVTTQRAAYRQFDNIIADLDYELPSRNAFDRKVDHDTPWNSGNDLGGASLNIDVELRTGTLTSTSAYRYWIWDPSNDRDFTGLQALAVSANFAAQDNWSQEFRYAGSFSERLSGVIGVFALGQEVRSNPVQVEESGRDQWRFVQSTTSPLWATPGLFEGYGTKTTSSINSFSGAAFANIDWEVIDGLHVLPGIRWNYDTKDVKYDRKASGGIELTDPALLALRRSVYSDQAYVAEAQEDNLTGQLTLAYKVGKRINAFGTYSTSFKPVGVNVAGLPTIAGRPDSMLAVIRPEYVTHYEFGLKTSPSRSSIVNIVFHNTDITDYQTQVQSPQLGVNRGYLANAEQVRVLGVEVDANLQVGQNFSLYGAVAWTEGTYVSFTNAPLPLEETGAPVSFKDISGGRLPGISTWAGSLGGEFSHAGRFLGQVGKYFFGLDAYYRSEFSSSPSPSQYLNIDGYGLLNSRLGFRSSANTSIVLWGRNILDVDYHEQLLPAGGNAGHYASVLGDQRTYGITFRQSF
jgi:iron complex outermembrane receptor protein